MAGKVQSSDMSANVTPMMVNEAFDQLSMQVRNQQTRAFTMPVAILWDIENCPVPSDVRAEDVAGNIRLAIRVHPAVKGAVTLFSAYGDFNNFPRKVREGCQRTGVNLIDVPNGKKDAADKAILVDMFLYALDYPPPSTIFLISGDVDFAPALHKLGQRGYTVVLAIPAGVGVASALLSSGQFVWDWPSVARGEGLVPAKSVLSKTNGLHSCQVTLLGDESELPNDEEAIVYTGSCNNSSFRGSRSTQNYTMHSTHLASDNSKVSLGGPSTQVSSSTTKNHQMQTTSSQTNITMNLLSSSAKQTTRPFQRVTDNGRSEEPSDPCPGPDSDMFVQPGDIQGLKTQLVKLVNMAGGSLFLNRIPAEYHKLFGRPLYLAEYGSCKLVSLAKKMSDTFCIDGKGHTKVLFLKRSAISYINDGSNINPSNKTIIDMINRGEHAVKLDRSKGKERAALDTDPCHSFLQEDCLDVSVVCCCEGKSSEERQFDIPVNGQTENSLQQCQETLEMLTVDSRLETFKQELQELLVSHACKIFLPSFLPLYRQRYSKDLVYGAFGVKELEALLERVKDIAVIEEEQSTKRKFLFAKCGYRNYCL